MLADCYKNPNTINAKGKPFPPEALIMSVLLSQQKMIDRLTTQGSNNSNYIVFMLSIKN